jgi:hypothetical protein
MEFIKIRLSQLHNLIKIFQLMILRSSNKIKRKLKNKPKRKKLSKMLKRKLIKMLRKKLRKIRKRLMN